MFDDSVVNKTTYALNSISVTIVYTVIKLVKLHKVFYLNKTTKRFIIKRDNKRGRQNGHLPPNEINRQNKTKITAALRKKTKHIVHNEILASEKGVSGSHARTGINYKKLILILQTYLHIAPFGAKTMIAELDSKFE